MAFTVNSKSYIVEPKTSFKVHLFMLNKTIINDRLKCSKSSITVKRNVFVLTNVGIFRLF